MTTIMTIEWRYTIEQDFAILSVAGHLGQDAAHRFTGAIGWVLARGTGPVVDCDLAAALTAHRTQRGTEPDGPDEPQEWRTGGWPS
ncbi:hypothetical protein [Streptomyces sp. NPDC059063]|uniref:hypothetical protein n=1 Tax=unclassified Streptomyces TaxID=2593676 RepID=UPI0036A96308